MKRGTSLTIMGLILAAIGIASPIAWDWWSNRTGLTLTYLHTVKIIEKKENIAGLSILFNEALVENLSRSTFILKNTGRSPIVNSDIISPPQIGFTNSKILSVNTKTLNPQNIEVNLESKNGSVYITFDLLNGNDSIIFSVLTDSSQPEFYASSRIKNIKNITIQKEEDQVQINTNVGWTVYLVGIISAFFLLLTLTLFSQGRKKKKFIKAIKEKDIPIHTGETVEVVKQYVNDNLSFLTEDHKTLVIEQIPDDVKVLSDEQAESLISVIKENISKEEPTAGGIITLVISIVGFWYIFNRIFI